MKEEHIQTLLKASPGARRAADGVIFDTDYGYFYAYDTEKLEDGISEQEHADWPYCSRNEIIRLREIKTSHDYLLRLRADAVGRSTRLARAFARRKKAFEKSGRPWSLTDYYATLNGPIKSYLQRLPRRQAAALRQIPSGFVAVEQANAISLKTMTGDIVFASEFLNLFFYFSFLCLYGSKIGIDLAIITLT